MANWPVGVETTQIIFGKGITAVGDYLKSSLEITPIFQGTATVVWDADGTPILPNLVKANADSGQFGMVSLPVVDQPGWLDDSQAPYAMWGYRLTEKYDGASPRVKFVQPLMGQTQIDFDRIPEGNIGLPASGPQVSVTSVGGFTGAVTAEDLQSVLEPGGPGTAPDWGTIGGDLAQQADLAAELGSRVPATRTVNGKPLGDDVTLTAGDVGALPDGYVPPAPDWIDVANKPTTFAPIVGTSAVTAAAGNDPRLAKADSAVQPAALDALAPLASPAFTGTPTGITKAHVGLGNVSNTSDANKPVSTAQAAAIAAGVGGVVGATTATVIQSAASYPTPGPGFAAYKFIGSANPALQVPALPLPEGSEWLEII